MKESSFKTILKSKLQEELKNRGIDDSYLDDVLYEFGDVFINALVKATETFSYGYKKYGSSPKGNGQKWYWQECGITSHINHAQGHLNGLKINDDSEDHAGHLVARTMLLSYVGGEYKADGENSVTVDSYQEWVKDQMAPSEIAEQVSVLALDKIMSDMKIMYDMSSTKRDLILTEKLEESVFYLNSLFNNLGTTYEKILKSSYNRLSKNNTEENS